MAVASLRRTHACAPVTALGLSRYRSGPRPIQIKFEFGVRRVAALAFIPYASSGRTPEEPPRELPRSREWGCDGPFAAHETKSSARV